MQDIQEIFNRIQETKTEQRGLKAMYADALDSSKTYKEITEKLKELKAKKKEIEDQTKADLGKDYDKLEILKLDIKHDREMLSDIALNKLVKGEPVKVVDKDSKEYEPVFSVTFRKQNTSNA
jgi:hypothetical protein